VNIGPLKFKDLKPGIRRDLVRFVAQHDCRYMIMPDGAVTLHPMAIDLQGFEVSIPPVLIRSMQGLRNELGY